MNHDEKIISLKMEQLEQQVFGAWLLHKRGVGEICEDGNF